jgi:formylglycine-generating enzyme required for sulfatase activity
MKAVCRRILIVLALCAGVCPPLMSATGYQLAIKPAGKAVVLSWSTNAANYILQSSVTLNAANWVAVGNPVVVNAGNNTVAYTNDSVTRFFRLFLSNPGFYLSITRASNTVTLSWPAAASNYVLQTSVSLSPASWATIMNPPPSLQNNTNYLTYTNNSLTRFFRLYLNTNATGGGISGMALIPAGPFTMGNVIVNGNTTTNDPDISDANPVTVTVSQFYMDTNLVSYGLWESVYNWATSAGYNFVNGGSSLQLEANQPVQSVDWYDTVKWCNARSQQASLTPVYYTDAGLTQVYTNGEINSVYANWSANGYRLPTEAEWEKAARGGLNGMRFPASNTISESQANYYVNTNAYNYDLGPTDGNNYLFTSQGQPYTSPVGFFGPNGYGLYDMAGNVLEWCWDWYGTPYAGGTDPHGPSPGSNSNRILRGGDWNDDASWARCASRSYYSSIGGPFYSPTDAFNFFGFRCVRAH